MRSILEWLNGPITKAHAIGFGVGWFAVDLVEAVLS